MVLNAHKTWPPPKFHPANLAYKHLYKINRLYLKRYQRSEILVEIHSFLNLVARVWLCLGNSFAFIRQCLVREHGDMRPDRFSLFGSRWRRHGFIEVSSRSERSRGMTRTETGELFSPLHRAFVPQQEARRARIAACPRSDAYPGIHCLVLFALFLFSLRIESWESSLNCTLFRFGTHLDPLEL